MPGGLVIELSPQELCDPTAALFRCNVEIHRAAAELAQSFRGRPLQVGEFRGTVVSVAKNVVHLENGEGTKKSVPLTAQRLGQLAASGATQRK